MATQATFLIVGSGGGGGTIAWLLAKAGHKVTLLEQGADLGKRRDPAAPYDPAIHDETYFRLRKPDPKRRLRGDYCTFAELGGADPRAQPFDGGWTASVLGGGSVLWGTWAFRPMPIDFKLRTLFKATGQLADLDQADYTVADWPVDYSAMMPFFHVAETLLGVSGDRAAVNASVQGSPWYRDLSSQFGGQPWFGDEQLWFPKAPFPLGAYPTTPVGRFAADGFEAAGMASFPTPVAIVQPGSGGFSTKEALRATLAVHRGALGGVWEQKLDHLWSEQVRQACNMCGYCGEYLCWGRTGPKWGTQDTTLRELRHTPNATVRCHAKALEVVYDPGSRRATGVAYLDLSDPDHPQRREQQADYVIVSCGAVQTARLLLMSGPPEGLGNSHGQVGRNAMFHQFGLGAVAKLDTRFQGLLHGELGPTGNTTTYSTYFLKDAQQRWIKGGHLTSTAKKNPLDDARTAVVRERQFGNGLLNRLLDNNRTLEIRLTGDDLPAKHNTVTLDPDFVDEYGVPVARITRKLGQYEKDGLAPLAKEAMKSVFDGYTRRGLLAAEPVLKSAVVDLIGDHQMGTCRMGDDPASSVLNRYCRMHEVANVFVVDSSFMPTGLGLNPMVTVVANALRVGTHIANRLAHGQEPGCD